MFGGCRKSQVTRECSLAALGDLEVIQMPEVKLQDLKAPGALGAPLPPLGCVLPLAGRTMALHSLGLHLLAQRLGTQHGGRGDSSFFW